MSVKRHRENEEEIVKVKRFDTHDERLLNCVSGRPWSIVVRKIRCKIVFNRRV